MISSVLLLELLPMNGSNLGAAACLELFSELLDIGISGEPMHLTVVAPIHLLQSKRSLLLHLLRKLLEFRRKDGT